MNLQVICRYDLIPYQKTVMYSNIWAKLGQEESPLFSQAVATAAAELAVFQKRLQILVKESEEIQEEIKNSSLEVFFLNYIIDKLLYHVYISMNSSTAERYRKNNYNEDLMRSNIGKNLKAAFDQLSTIEQKESNLVEYTFNVLKSYFNNEEAFNKYKMQLVGFRKVSQEAMREIVEYLSRGDSANVIK